MTNERDKEDMDTRVSETYRELSAPRVPDHLNQTILRMAASKRPGKSDFLFAAWVKPVTLAATIALSLAIVLELTEVPTTAIQTEVIPAIEQQAESIAEEFAPQETDSLGRAESRSRAQFELNRMPVREDETAAADERIVEELVLKDTDLAKSEVKGKTNSFAASPAAAALPAARKRAADMPDSNQPAATSCDEKARLSADTWLDCIDKLRESGLTQDADREYEAFILEYPAEAANPEPNK